VYNAIPALDINKHTVIIVYDNSGHSSLRPFCVALAAIPIMSPDTRVILRYVVLGFGDRGGTVVNPLTPNDPYSGRTAQLTSKRSILYIYSTNKFTEYFKHGIYSPFFSLQNAVCFIILTYLVPVLSTFYIQNVLKFKQIIPAPKG